MKPASKNNLPSKYFWGFDCFIYTLCFNMESGPERRIRSANLDYDIFKSIYVAFYPRLKTYAEKYVDAEEAGDIVQDAFLYVWSRKEELQYGERFFNYMLKSVHNACMNAVSGTWMPPTPWMPSMMTAHTSPLRSSVCIASMSFKGR